MNQSFFSILTCAALVVLGTAGCSSDTTGKSSGGTTSSGSTGSSGTTGGTQYKGTFAGKGEGGSIDVTVSAAGGDVTQKSIHPMATLQVSGTLKITGGTTSTITGTFDDVTNTLTITGGGYTFTGKLGSTGITGTYSGPNGSGNFSVLSGAASKAYCGTYGAGASTSGAGVWNFTVNGTALVGSYSDVKGTGGGLTGTVAGDGKVDIKTDGGTATGAISGDTANGTYPGGAWTGKGC